tara:strand:- start:1001 stop:1237 length:237 start_codon:yes stop_codon:yes gene_type:complete
LVDHKEGFERVVEFYENIEKAGKVLGVSKKDLDNVCALSSSSSSSSSSAPTAAEKSKNKNEDDNLPPLPTVQDSHVGE